MAPTIGQACCKHETIRCYSIAICIQLFITLFCNSTTRIGFQIRIQELVIGNRMHRTPSHAPKLCRVLLIGIQLMCLLSEYL